MTSETWLPFEYRAFHDIPRLLAVTYDDSRYLFDAPFDETTDEYREHYAVYRLPPWSWDRLEDQSWTSLPERGEKIGELRCDEVRFDETKRRALHASVLEQVLSSAPPRRRVIFSADALEYVQSELTVAAGDGFDGPLASRLRELELGTPYSYVRKGTAANRDFASGWTDDGSSDLTLAALISRWLGAQDPGRHRVMILEEALARYSDPATDPETPHLEEQVYFVATTGADPERVARTWRRHSDYPGIGLVSRASRPILPGAELTTDDIDDWVASAVAVLVRAWDGEAYLVAPVAGQQDIV